MKKYSTVPEFLIDLDEDTRNQVNALRDIILSSVNVTEHIKWNAPSYVFNGEDRITFNLHGSDIKILIHMGATRKEDKAASPVLNDLTGIIQWNSNIRGTLTFRSMEEIIDHTSDLGDILKKWVAID